MKTLLFTVSSRHKIFFNNIKSSCSCDVDIVYTKKILIPSFKSLFFLNKIDLSAPIELRTKDFIARDKIKIPRIIIKFYYTILAYLTYIFYFSQISNKYDQIMLWNGMTFRQAIALQIASLYDIKPIYVENGVMPNRIVVDKKGVNFNNSVPRDKEFYQTYTNDKPLPKELIPRTPKNAKKFENIKKEQLPKNYIFVPFQLDYDTQIMLFSPWIKDMRMLFDIIENIAKNTNINFVFKEHPTSIKNYPDLHQKASVSEHIMFANGYPTQELIERSIAVITVNSTVGIESLLLGKKVITLGNAFYNIEDIVYHCTDEHKLLDTLNKIDKIKREDKLIENFLKYLYYDYLIEGSFKESTSEQIDKISKIINS